MSFKRDLEEIKTKKEELKNSVFKGAEMMTVLWETKPEIIERILPPPLKPAERPICIAFIANYPSTNQGQPYHESDLFLRVKFNDEYGNYHLAMHVTDDRAMIGGREICGFPKKMAHIKLERKDTDVKAWSERLGTRNIEINAKLTGKFNSSETPDLLKQFKILPTRKRGAVSYNFKYFPSPDKTGFDYPPRLVRQETLIRPQSMEMGEVEITLNSSVHDPWGELEIVNVLGALYLKTNNTMLPGEVVAEVDPKEFLPYSFIKLDWY
ncbi:MAG: acetoacetate decarboxylase family protein [Candidatus Helarchaeota archaeon]|nr:acetoacetate decarboxylase family protein [Candidatus Helarchaeota archaeon]